MISLTHTRGSQMGHPMFSWWPESALPRDSILLVSWWHVLARATSAPKPRKDDAQVPPKIPKKNWKQAVEWSSKKAVHPEKLTCPLKRDYSNRKYIFQPLIFGGHVSFRGSNSDGMNQFPVWLCPRPQHATNATMIPPRLQWVPSVPVHWPPCGVRTKPPPNWVDDAVLGLGVQGHDCLPTKHISPTNVGCSPNILTPQKMMATYGNFHPNGISARPSLQNETEVEQNLHMAYVHTKSPRNATCAPNSKKYSHNHLAHHNFTLNDCKQLWLCAFCASRFYVLHWKFNQAAVQTGYIT